MKSARDDGDDDGVRDADEEELRPQNIKRLSGRSQTNGYTECGRHSNDWLFGGISFTEIGKKMLFKKKQ